MPRNKPGLSLSQLGFRMEDNASPIPGIPSNAANRGDSRAPSNGTEKPIQIQQKQQQQPGAIGASSQGNAGSQTGLSFLDFKDFVDPTGKLSFEGKAVISANGVDFSNGKSYQISMAQMKVLEVLGRGQYGVVHKVFHQPTHVTMALKEIRLELNKRALQQIIMELDVLHKARSPYIVDFYGAFFVESCVYYCMEYMDFGSLDRLYPSGIPEAVLAKITLSVVKGLQFLKTKLNIMHRDVKPTNILVNKKGEVKLCDFGVSGELNKSLAKTHVGCQSYMAPERIVGTSGPEGYTIQSDVWSLGLTIIEVATARFPYDTAGFTNIFDQLNAIVNGDPPKLPSSRYSPNACDFVAKCLAKESKNRPNYQKLLDHPWLAEAESSEVDMEEWASRAHALFLTRSNASNSSKMPPPARPPQ
ncbi:MAP kinase kinase Wis1 [Coemansia brasiliensis]|uniref:mitogen-activated protein kinase kinase n=1 Tax=Coemansia brasiliensis TaxID=2650707 RepID=A0A9W8IGY9_9FUNG|nr:MAP kinase kinase Wis1 [Coemansia brasiliensis]